MKSLERGYTLLELIVVVALLTGLSAALLLNRGTSEDVMRLNNAATQLESLITQAQAYGNSGKAFPENSTDSDRFDRGYGVYVERDSGTVVMYGGDDTAPPIKDKYQHSYQEYQTVTLEGGVIVSNIAFTPTPSHNAEAHIFFVRGKNQAGIHAGPAAPEFNYKDAVRITLTKSGMSRVVVVNKTGLIYIED